jgi:dienelactone hydrolase
MNVRHLALATICAAGTLAGCRAQQAPRPNLAQGAWLVLGPFANNADSGCPGFHVDHLVKEGGEARAAPRIHERAAGLAWRAVEAREGRLDLLGTLGQATSAVAYAYTEIEAASSGPAALKLGTDDGVKVWLNGDLVWTNHVHRALRRDEDAVVVDLVAGWNRLLLKVDQGTGAWELAARVGAVSQEAEDWAAATNPGLVLRVADGNTAFVVTTLPALAVREPVAVTIAAPSGEDVGSVTTVTGASAHLSLPAGQPGVYRLVARATGGRADVARASAIALQGDATAIAAQTAALARELEPGEEQAAATLEHLAEQIEGQLHPTLTTPDRTLRSIAAVWDIRAALRTGPWRPDSLRGLRPWAYRSRIDGSLQPYTLYLPESYDSSRAYPLIVALHGYSDNDYTMAAAVARGAPADFVVVAPYGRGDMGYRSTAEEDVLDVLDVLQGLYNVDPQRIYLMGISMGGMGAWRIGQHYTDRFAAVAPFCGWTGTEYLDNLRNTPVLVVHGDSDNTVSVEMEGRAVAALRLKGAPVTYYELPGVGHDAWGAWTADRGPERLYEFFRAHVRNPWPTALAVSVDHTAYGRHFWVTVDAIEAWPKAGHLEARVASDRRLDVTPSGIHAFTLDLRHPALAQTGRIVMRIDGQDLEAPAGAAALSVVRTEGGWRAQAAPDTGPRPPHGGGLTDLFRGPLAIVYGTTRHDRTAVLRNAAQTLADWAPTTQIPIGSKVGRFRIVADTEVTEADLHANLLLVGDAAENRLTGPTLAGMPLRWENGALTVGTRRVAGAAFVAVHPSVSPPGYLRGVLTLPADASATDRSLYYAMLRARGYNLDETATHTVQLADVVIYGSLSAFAGGSAVWAGVFDREWREVREVSGP